MTFDSKISALLERAARLYPKTEVVTRSSGRRSTWGEVHDRARRVASSLRRLGVRPGERVGTLAWNTQRHIELYYAIPGAGCVIHTLNLRLFPEQIAWIVNHADDRVIFVDDVLVPLLERVAPALRNVKAYVVLGDGPLPKTSLAPLVPYEDLVTGGDPGAALGTSERSGLAMLCYTSGTTGNPKGVPYDHEFLVNVARVMSMTNNFAIGERDTIFAAVPLFHAAGWCLPYVGAMNGAKLVVPGPNLQPADIAASIDAERVTFTAGVPTLWSGVADLLEREGRRFETLERIICAGAAVPAPLIARWEKLGVRMQQAWGMTEALVGTLACLKRGHAGLSADEKIRVLAKQGLPIPFLDMRVVDADGKELPRDGESRGELEIKGPTVISEYFQDERSAAAFRDGWFRTGDVATIDADGYLEIRDRTKDVIKSGGEWISSLDIEALLVGHPEVAEAAVIARPDEKWSERPLACVVLRKDAQATPESLAAFLAPKLARWWNPDTYSFVAEIPKTGVGKVDKKLLRERLAKGEIEVLRVPGMG